MSCAVVTLEEGITAGVASFFGAYLGERDSGLRGLKIGIVALTTDCRGGDAGSGAAAGYALTIAESRALLLVLQIYSKLLDLTRLKR